MPYRDLPDYLSRYIIGMLTGRFGDMPLEVIRSWCEDRENPTPNGAFWFFEGAPDAGVSLYHALIDQEGPCLWVLRQFLADEVSRQTDLEFLLNRGEDHAAWLQYALEDMEAWAGRLWEDWQRHRQSGEAPRFNFDSATVEDFWRLFGTNLSYKIRGRVCQFVADYAREPLAPDHKDGERGPPEPEAPNILEEVDVLSEYLQAPVVQYWLQEAATFRRSLQGRLGDHARKVYDCLERQAQAERQGEDPLRKVYVDLRFFFYLDVDERGTREAVGQEESRKAFAQIFSGEFWPCVMKGCCKNSGTKDVHNFRVRGKWMDYKQMRFAAGGRARERAHCEPDGS